MLSCVFIVATGHSRHTLHGGGLMKARYELGDFSYRERVYVRLGFSHHRHLVDHLNLIILTII